MLIKRIPVLLIAICAFILIGQVASVSAAELDPTQHSAPEQALRPVQVFDVAAGKVVKSISNDAEFQKHAAAWTGSITGLAPQMTSDASCTYVYRIPLAVPMSIKINEISVSTTDLFLFYCKDKPPLILVFDENRKPYLFLFNADINPFLKKVGVPAMN